jgi:hypothetical protein
MTEDISPELVLVDPALAGRGRALLDLAGIDDDVDAALDTVAALPYPPEPRERQVLAALAARIGRGRLFEALDEPGPRRLAAVRLLSA